MDKNELEESVNSILLSNGWDYEDRKRVFFMLRNQKPRERGSGETVDAAYERYLQTPNLPMRIKHHQLGRA